MSSEKDILSLTKKLIAIPSDPGNAPALSRALDTALSQLKGFTIERFERNGVKSALVYNTRTRPKRFKVLLNTHLDVIPGKKSQYTARIRGKKLYGVGAMDMKANLAAALFAFKDVAKDVSYPIALQLVTDEEVGGFDGTKYQVEKGVRADFVLATEPTNFDVVHKTKGVLWLEIRAKGKTAHGAYPWRGRNAVLLAQECVHNILRLYPSPKTEAWVTTVNVSQIESSNTTYNKIPDDCIVRLDIRYVPSDAKNILQKIRSVLPAGCSMKVVANEPVIDTPAGNTYIQLLNAVSKNTLKKGVIMRGAQGSSDARHFTRVKCAGIEFGPIGGGIGSDNEWVSIPSLAQFKRILEEFLSRCGEVR